MFFKRASHIIRKDFFKLCTDFYNHVVDLKSINHSYITLVPKVDNTEKVSDFRPISLINSAPKLVAIDYKRWLFRLCMRISMVLSRVKPYRIV
jgi:hypothetical protein